MQWYLPVANRRHESHLLLFVGFCAIYVFYCSTILCPKIFEHGRRG
jgi:hypothetical protein